MQHKKNNISFDDFFYTAQGNKWRKIGIQQRAGICTPLFSVHSSTSTGIGDFNNIKNLVDLCISTNCTILQILPLNIMGSDNCPYNTVSSFALDPVYISLSDFFYRGKGFSKETIKNLQSQYIAGKNNRCDYNVREAKLILLRELFDSLIEEIVFDSEFVCFVKKTKYWIDDFSVYLVLKKIHGGAAWYQWEEHFKEKNPDRIDKIATSYTKDILFHKWIQFICYKQLCEAKRYAEKKHVLLMGDFPILASRDSADVWAKRRFFNLEFVAGAPPDMYCVYGQRWGMPVQNREELTRDSFRYVIERLKYIDNFFDMIRIDHVVGLFRIWAISVDEPIENHGLNGTFIPSDEKLWKQHGKHILSIMNENSCCLLCGEDLGVIPDVCPKTLEELGIPGYDVQRWKKNYDTDFTFLQGDQYRKLAISTLSTHDTSFWLEWWRNEARTVERKVFELKVKRLNLNSDLLIQQLFETGSSSDRMKWKKEINSIEKLVQILGKDSSSIMDIIHFYQDTFDEKEKLKKLLGIFEEKDETDCLKKALEFVYKSSSIFCINLLPDVICLDKNISKQISHLRINKPGTKSETNWNFAFEQPLEDLAERIWVEEIRQISR